MIGFTIIWHAASKYELSTIKMLYSLKKIVILHPNLPITATSPQQALSSVPKMAIVKRFSCIYITIFFCWNYTLGVINIAKDKYCLWPHLIQLLLYLHCRKKTEGEDASNKSKEDAEQYPQSRRLLSPKKHFA